MGSRRKRVLAERQALRKERRERELARLWAVLHDIGVEERTLHQEVHKWGHILPYDPIKLFFLKGSGIAVQISEERKVKFVRFFLRSTTQTLSKMEGWLVGADGTRVRLPPNCSFSEWIRPAQFRKTLAQILQSQHFDLL